MSHAYLFVSELYYLCITEKIGSDGRIADGLATG